MISIIGAGPVGSYLAYLLARQGRQVDVYEEHKTIGRPVHCTGIVSSKFSQLINPDKSFVINTINRARLYSPDGRFIELQLGDNYILDRAKLDKKLAEGAEKAGAVFHTSSKFIGYDPGSNTLSIKSGRTLCRTKTNLLVGADGPLSQVAKSAGLFNGRKFFTGIQARARLENDNSVEFYLVPDGLAWVVPESRSIVRIGIASKSDPNKRFTRFLTAHLGDHYQRSIIEYQGGLIPLHNPKIKAHSGSVYLVGDAATMVKPTTWGGIVQGLIGAEALAESVQLRKDYDSLWREKIGRELRLGLMLRRVMDRFSEKDYNLLIRLMDKKGIKEKLAGYDRDTLTSLLPGLAAEAIKEPRFLYFARFLPFIF